MSDPTITDIHRYESAGSVAAYEHCAMIRLHYHVADALDDCLRRLTGNEEGVRKIRHESTTAMHAAHQAALHNTILGIPDHVDASTETSSSGDDEDDEGRSGFDQTEGYVSSTRKRNSFVMKEHP
jgi:hypothetical protein